MEALPTASLEPGTLVFGDLHLCPTDPADAEEFASWLGGVSDCPRLVILGDLFEFWVGPAQEREGATALVLDALAAANGRGIAVDLVPGNRDFLLGAAFEERTGAALRPHGLIGRAPGSGAEQRPGKVLFLHGDELSTRDRSYQRLRRVLRSRPVAWLSVHLPGSTSLALARGLRRASRRAVDAKSPLETEMQAEEAERRLVLSACAHLVCGHAHRFEERALSGGRSWTVLDAWGGDRDLLALDADGSWRAASHRAPPTPLNP